MPHGRLGSYLWELFPDEYLLSTSELDWTIAIREHSRWYVIPEHPDDPGYLLSSKDCEVLPLGDFYLLPETEDSIVLCSDHEGIGPWRITGKKRQPIRHPAGSHSLVSVQVAEESLARAVGHDLADGRLRASWLKSALRRKGIRIPDYPLPKSGVGRDWLWNYIPAEYEVKSGSGSILEMLVTNASGVEATTDGSSCSFVWNAPSLKRMLKVPDAYYVEWPLRRWVISVPAPFVQHGASGSPVWVSLVILR